MLLNTCVTVCKRQQQLNAQRRRPLHAVPVRLAQTRSGGRRYGSAAVGSSRHPCLRDFDCTRNDCANRERATDDPAGRTVQSSSYLFIVFLVILFLNVKFNYMDVTSTGVIRVLSFFLGGGEDLYFSKVTRRGVCHP